VASIPLVAQGIQQPQPFNPERLLALKSMLGQQQLQQQQIQGSELENKIRTQQLQDRQTLQEIAPKYVKKNDDGQPTGFDYDGFSADAQQRGVSPATMSQLATMQKTYADTLKAKADAGQTTLQTQEKLLGDAYNHLEGIRGETDPAQRQAKWQSALQWAQQNNLPGATNLPPQAPDDKSLTGTEAQLGMHAQAVADVKTQTDIQKSQAETAQASAGTAAKNAEALWYQQHPNAGAPGVPAENVSAADWLAKNPGKTFSDYTVAMKKIVPAYNFSLQNQGATGANGQPSAIAQSLANGTMKWQDAVSPRTPIAVKQQLLAEVKSIKPDFNTGDFELEQSVRKEFTSGDAAKNLTAFSTAIEHAKQAQEAADALDNGDIKALNRVGNALGVQFGSNKLTNFQTIKAALSGEISKVFKGGQATDAEIKEVQAPFDSAGSPAQLRGALDTAIKLMNSKRDALKEQYEQGVKGKPNFSGGTASHPFFDQFGGTAKPQQ